MSSGKITETTIIRGNDTFKAFLKNGILQTSDSLKSYTLITFYNIKANQDNIYLFSENLEVNYKTELITVDLPVDNLNPEKDTRVDRSDFQVLIGIHLFRDNQKTEQHLLALSSGNRNDLNIFFLPNQKIQFTSDIDLNSLTFWCKPVYIYPEISPRKLSEID